MKKSQKSKSKTEYLKYKKKLYGKWGVLDGNEFIEKKKRKKIKTSLPYTSITVWHTETWLSTEGEDLHPNGQQGGEDKNLQKPSKRPSGETGNRTKRMRTQTKKTDQEREEKTERNLKTTKRDQKRSRKDQAKKTKRIRKSRPPPAEYPQTDQDPIEEGIVVYVGSVQNTRTNNLARCLTSQSCHVRLVSQSLLDSQLDGSSDATKALCYPIALQVPPA